MTLTHKCLSQKKITNFKWGKITQYLVFEEFDVVVQATLLDDVNVPSLDEPTDGVWFRMLPHYQFKPLDNLY
jgi:hypothetical protein